MDWLIKLVHHGMKYFLVIKGCYILRYLWYIIDEPEKNYTGVHEVWRTFYLKSGNTVCVD